MPQSRAFRELYEIKKEDLRLALPTAIEEREDNVKKWPHVTYCSIFNYFLESTASDGKAMQNLKSSEAYQYLHSDKGYG